VENLGIVRDDPASLTATGLAFVASDSLLAICVTKENTYLCRLAWRRKCLFETPHAQFSSGTNFFLPLPPFGFARIFCSMLTLDFWTSGQSAGLEITVRTMGDNH
jgi:hypothetical protein